MKLEIGKIKRLQQISDNGLFKIIAIDHSDVFVTLLQESGKSYDSMSVREEKLNVISSVRNYISGLLVDTKITLPLGILDEIIPGHLGFMVNYEGNNYDTQEFDQNYFTEGLTVKKILEIGSSALKLFFYYDPYSKDYSKLEILIKELADACDDLSLPLLIEPILHPTLDKEKNNEKKISLTYQMLERLSQYKVDIFKIAFPGDIKIHNKEKNLEICKNVTEILDVPWVLLSSGAGMDDFIEQLKLSCDGGASGYVAGRTLWQDFVGSSNDRTRFLQQMQNNISLLNDIVDSQARRWTDIEGIWNYNFCQEDWFV